MKVISIVGARPQFIKSAPVSAALRAAGHAELLIHTGQHYDHNMSQVFFDEMGISKPYRNLGIGSGSHGWQTGQMLMQLENVLEQERPDWVVVYGDTNSTLAAALAAVKINLHVAHVEAGLRSFNRAMPEEHNRILTDHCATLLCCPTQTAMTNLAYEGIGQRAHLVGDTMYDAVLRYAVTARRHSTMMATYELAPKAYCLATLHRPYNTDVSQHLRDIFAAFGDIRDLIVLPIHPRTRHALAASQVPIPDNVRLIDPVGYLDMLMLEENARLILTDSGGIQKEAYLLAVPCVTLRPETEWVETVEAGWNVVVGADRGQIVSTVNDHRWPQGAPPTVFGDGHASEKIVDLLAGCN
ncbi:MAG: UDP-N-acetylglucosamine 2-epimerase (non-hydrolyzing) [Chloroflexota bacterium]